MLETTHLSHLFLQGADISGRRTDACSLASWAPELPKAVLRLFLVVACCLATFAFAMAAAATPAMATTSAEDTRPSQQQVVDWSSARIPAPVAKVLMGRRGHLYLVEETLDRITYVSVPGFPVGAALHGYDLPFEDPGARGALGLAGALPGGDRVAYVATEGRSPSEVADTLYALARQVRSEEQRAVGIPKAHIILLVGMVVMVFGLCALVALFVGLALTRDSKPQDSNPQDFNPQDFDGGGQAYEESEQQLYY